MTDLLTQSLQQISSAIFVVEASTEKILDVNKSTLKLHGYTRNELIGMSPVELSNTFPTVTQWADHVFEARKRKNLTVHTEHIRKDGSTFPARVDVNHIEMEGEEYIVAIVKDVTEDRGRNPSLYKSESHYSSVFEEAPHALWEKDLSRVKERIDELREQGITEWATYFDNHPKVVDELIESIQVIDVNRRTLQLYGAKNIDDLRRHFRSTIGSYCREKLKDQLVRLARGERELTQEFVTKTLNGQLVHIHLKLVVPPGHHDDLGQVFVSVEDITEQREAQQQLEKSERWFRSTFEQAAVGITHVAPDGTFLHVNDRFCSLLGYDRTELLNKSFRDITHPDHLERDTGHMERLLRGEEDQYSTEKRYHRKDGSVLWAQLTVGLVRNTEGIPRYFISVVQDITARKQAQQELRASERSLQKMYKITTDPESSFDEKVYNLLRIGIERLGVDAGFVTGIESTDLHIEYEVGGEGVMKEGVTVDLNKTFCRATVESEGFENVEDAMKEGYEDELGEGFPYRGYRGAQILVDDELYGTLCFESRDSLDKPPTDAEESFVRLLAQWLGHEIQRRQVEAKLRESEQKFRHLSENIEAVFWLSTPEKDVYYVSSAFEEIWGVPAEELYDDFENFIEVIHPEERERVKEALYRDQATGNYDEEYRIIRPDGEVRWIHDQAYPIKNDSGEVVRIAGVAEDITERKELREERDQFFNISLDLVCVADMDGYFLDINPAFTEVLGYDEDTLLSQPFIEFVHPEDRDKTREVMGRLREGKDVNNFENRNNTADGKIRWLQWNATPRGDRIYSVSRDITKQREYRDQLEEALNEKQVLLEEIHHRVKNNLQVISSLLDMQSQQIDDRQSLEAFQDSVSRIHAMALIHEKLYESESLDQVNLQHYLTELGMHLMDSRASEPQEISFDIDETNLSLDQAISLGMIVNELVSNAIEHGFDPDEAGEITVSLEIQEEKAHLTVRDTGRGFPEDYELEKTSTMGMRIIHSLVNHELNGAIDFEDKNGLLVTVKFPIS